MATGGVSNVLHMCKSDISQSETRSTAASRNTNRTLTVPYDAPWLMGVGTFFFLLNITLFLTNCVLICTRFFMRPGSFVHSFTDQVESLFIPAFVSNPIFDMCRTLLTRRIVCLVCITKSTKRTITN